jgi:type I restriction enzyme S subunit
MKFAADRGVFGRVSGQTSIAHLTKETLVDIEVPHPRSIGQQQRIAKILDTADDRIEVLDQIIEKHQTIRDGIAHAAVYFESLAVGERSMVPIDQILKGNPGTFIQTGPFGSQLHADEYTLDGIPVVMPQDIVKGSISTRNIARILPKKAIELSRHRMKEGDVVLARRGDLNRCAVVTNDQAGWLCGTGCLLVRLPKSVILPGWFALAYQDELCQRQIATVAVGSTMVNLNARIVAGIKIPVPVIELQAEMLSALDAQNDVIASLMREVEGLNLIKQGLMDDLLTGRVPVTDDGGMERVGTG